MIPDISHLSASQLDELIARAIKLRETLAPQHPSEAPKQVELEATYNPPWQLTLIHEGSLLQIRHPGSGWLNFLIPPKERAQMVGHLTMQALMAPPALSDVIPGPKVTH